MVRRMNLQFLTWFSCFFFLSRDFFLPFSIKISASQLFPHGIILTLHSHCSTNTEAHALHETVNDFSQREYHEIAKNAPFLIQNGRITLLLGSGDFKNCSVGAQAIFSHVLFFFR
jgi:hypothetical protein